MLGSVYAPQTAIDRGTGASTVLPARAAASWWALVAAAMLSLAVASTLYQGLGEA
jgi:hypothetical protein